MAYNATPLVSAVDKHGHASVNNSSTSRPTHKRATVDALEAWFSDNIHYPYPSSETKTAFATAHAMSNAQVNTWFMNARKRSPYKKEMKFRKGRAVEVFEAWFKDNLHYPYPSSETKTAFASEYSMSNTQVNTWFVNARKRSPYKTEKNFRKGRVQLVETVHRDPLDGVSDISPVGTIAAEVFANFCKGRHRNPRGGVPDISPVCTILR